MNLSEIYTITKTNKPKNNKSSKTKKIKKVKKVKVAKEPKNKTKKEPKKIDINIIGDRILPKDSILIMNEKISNQHATDQSSKQYITDFKTHGISVLEKLAESDLNQMIILANDRYYNEDPIMTDNEYDILKEFIERKFPKNTIVDAVGAPISAKNKVKLPYEMWSMDKIKPDSNALALWKAKYKGPYTLSCKLDGVSGMYTKDSSNQYKPTNNLIRNADSHFSGSMTDKEINPSPKGYVSTKDLNLQQFKLYTRGNGIVGQDISHLIEPLHLPKTESTGAIRGEFIISKRVFQEKYKDKFANPRNMVAGIINKQSWDDRINDLKFVTYEIIEPKMAPSKQLQTLQSTGFDTVMFKVETEATLTNELLSALLLDWRQNSEFEIDGIIVTDDHVHDRVSSNPAHAFAFKMVISDQMAEAKVVDVLWEASKSGYFKPRVRIEPIQLGGVRIEYATGFNGKFIKDNCIGLGAIIQIVRSGDVIPYIQSIVQPAEFTKMPEQAYHWTESHVDIVLDDLESDPKVLEKNIAAFFVELEVDGLAKGNIKRLIDAGFDSVAKILRMTKADFERVGFKALADKFVSGIASKVGAATLPQIMSASNKLGRGISGKTIEIIMLEEPDIVTLVESDEYKIAKLVKIKGVGKVVAKTFVEHIGEFLAFLRECGLENKLHGLGATETETETGITTVARQFDESNPLFGKKIVMTKVRDQDIIKHLSGLGAILADSVTSDTFTVIVKSKEDTSGKVKKAMEKGIPIMTPEEFKIMYMV